MSSKSLRITLDKTLEAYLLTRTGESSPFAKPEDYVEDLIRREMKADDLSAAYLADTLGAAASATEESYLTVSAEDVIRRNSRS
ncbi:hypothetical protein [Rhizobium sp. CECT 9324]|jgi:hypothetical protein|uniref:hypothetical protein n=1 Tax=Rhizobium sp. CECT 9324 TaxID=2845820 RepID=UPI001E59E864|nr:hypothetical protein [Rhizobium sp. CECT 9324]CAH0339825.1 hypothetical protein RHI9324_01478 [Rhizobium sp. CECT 9324]